MDRHKKLSVLPPVSLYREDLIQLEKLLKKHVHCSGCDLSITPVEHNHRVTGTPFHSFSDLFNVKGVPHNVDQIMIDAKEVSEDKELKRDAQVYLSRRISYLRVLSPDDLEWVSATFSELHDFLMKKKVWYSFLARAIPPIFNTSLVISFMLAGLAIISNNYLTLIYPVVMLSCAIGLLVLNLNGKVYSVARINLYHESEETRPDYERFVIWIYFSIVILCIAGAVATTWQFLTGIA